MRSAWLQQYCLLGFPCTFVDAIAAHIYAFSSAVCSFASMACNCCGRWNSLLLQVKCVSLLMRLAWPSSCVQGSSRIMSPQALTLIMMSATNWCAADCTICAVPLPVCFLHTFTLRLLPLKENLKLHDSSIILSVSATPSPDGLRYRCIQL